MKNNIKQSKVCMLMMVLLMVISIDFVFAQNSNAAYYGTWEYIVDSDYGFIVTLTISANEFQYKTNNGFEYSLYYPNWIAINANDILFEDFEPGLADHDHVSDFFKDYPYGFAIKGIVNKTQGRWPEDYSKMTEYILINIYDPKKMVWGNYGNSAQVFVKK